MNIATITKVYLLFFVDSISNNRLSALQKWYRKNGMQPKEKRNAGRDDNPVAYTFDDTKRAVTFVSNYADDHALLLPGRVPGYKRANIRLMPSSETKVKVYIAYSAAMHDLGM